MWSRPRLTSPMWTRRTTRGGSTRTATGVALGDSRARNIPSVHRRPRNADSFGRDRPPRRARCASRFLFFFDFAPSLTRLSTEKRAWLVGPSCYGRGKLAHACGIRVARQDRQSEGVYKIRRLIGQGGWARSMQRTARAARRSRSRCCTIARCRTRTRRALPARGGDRVAHQEPVRRSRPRRGEGSNGRLWIAFERLEGEGLDERLRREQYLSFADVAPIMDDALQGLDAAHKAA